MPSSYEQTSLDRKRLESFARRVAKETLRPPNSALVKIVTSKRPVVRERSAGFLGLRTERYTVDEVVEQRQQVLGPYWMLFTTHLFSEYGKSDRFDAQEYEETNTWALTKDGALWKISEWKEWTSRAPGAWTKSDRKVEPMSDGDILELDHEHRQRSGHARGWLDSWSGNRDAGRVVRHAKGVGLSLALKSLLE